MSYIPKSDSVVAFQGNPSVLQVLATVANPTANQSVSGAVSVSNLPVTQNVSGSVVATQGTTPWNTITQGSVAVAIVSGSVAVTVTPPANQSVSGAVSISNFPTTQNVSGSVVAFGFPTNQNVSGSVVATQGTVPWIGAMQGSVAVAIISGSIAASFTPPANQSVSGTVGASIIGLTPIQVPGSVAVAIVSGSISATFTPPANQSVSGTVGASIIGLTPIQVPGSVAVAIVSGSISATFTPPANQSVSGTVGASIIGLTPIQIPGSVAVAIVSGSIAATFTPPANQSVSGTVNIGTGGPVSVLGTMSVIGTVPVTQATTEWTVKSSVSGGIFPISGSVAVGNFPTNQNVSGSVVAFVSGTPNVNAAGSVVAFQGTSPWVVQSIVGTYAEDAGHTSADKGLFILGVRNDTVASFVSADLEYTPRASDSAGRTIVKPFAPEDGTIINYAGSVVSGSVTLIQASVTGKRSYITDFWISNTGASNTLLTFQGGDTSIVGQFIAPTTGGMASPGIAIPLKNTLSQDLAFKVSPSSSVVYLVVKGYVAP